jgi:hypothetical protein
MAGMRQLIDQTANCLEDVWVTFSDDQGGYPGVRMQKLVEVMSKAVSQRIQVYFQGDEIWDTSVINVRAKLGECQKVIKYYETTIKEYPKRWQALRRWDLGEFDLFQIQQLNIRISEIFELRS